MEETKETTPKQRGDPFEEEAAPWQKTAATLAQMWAGPITVQFQGVDLVETIEYIISDQVNRLYLRDRNERQAK